MKQAKDTRFSKGTSGNPSGRPKGSGLATFRKELQEAWKGKEKDGSDGIRRKLVDLAKSGDLGAIRLVAERVCAPMKASEEAIPIPITGKSLTDRAKCVLDALGEGLIAPSQASQLLQGLGAMAKILEVDEHSKRLDAIEAELQRKGTTQ